MNKETQKKLKIDVFVEGLFKDFDLCEELKKEVKAYRVLFGIAEDRLARQSGLNTDLFTKCVAKDEVMKRRLATIQTEKKINKNLSKRIDEKLVLIEKLKGQLRKGGKKSDRKDSNKTNS